MLRAVRTFLAGRAKTKQRKDAESRDSCTIAATEDAAMRRFAAGRADNGVCGPEHYCNLASGSRT